MSLQVVSLTQIANQIAQPFHLRPLASIGSLIVSVFVCQGQMDWHKHLDEDEMFLVHEGVIGLDTDRGNLSVHAEELVVVPKGVQHRSHSMLRSVVVLIRPAILAERGNGHRHFYATDADPPLEKVRLARAMATPLDPFRPVALAQVEDCEVLGVAGRGVGPEASAPSLGAFWMAVRGGVKIEAAGDEVASLTAGDLAVVPPGTTYRLVCQEPSLLLTVARSL